MTYFLSAIWFLLLSLLGTFIYRLLHGTKKQISPVIILSLILSYGFISTTLITFLLGYLGLANQNTVLTTLLLCALITLLLTTKKTTKTFSLVADSVKSEKNLTLLLLSSLILSFIYFHLPGALFHETDSFFWISQAKELFFTQKLPQTTWLTPEMPHFFSFSYASFLSFIGTNHTSQELTRYWSVFNLPLVIIFWFGLIETIYPKLTFKPKLFSLIVFLSNPWFLGFLMGGEISPKLWGLLILLVCLQVIIKDKLRSKFSLNLYFLLLGLWLIHFAEVWFLFATLFTAYIFHKPFRQFFVEYPLLTIPLGYTIYTLINFILHILSPGFSGNYAVYTQQIFGLEKTLGMTGYLSGSISLLTAFLTQIKNPKKTPSAIILSLLLITLVVIYFPEAFAKSLKGGWQSYRNLQYFFIALSVFAGAGFSYLQNRKLLANLLLVFSLLILVMHSLQTYANRIGPIPQFVKDLSPAINSKSIIAESNLDVHKKSISFFDLLNHQIPMDKHIYIDLDAWDSQFYSISMLLPRKIYTTSYPENPAIHNRWSHSLRLLYSSEPNKNTDYLITSSKTHETDDLSSFELIDSTSYLVASESGYVTKNIYLFQRSTTN